LDYVRTGIFDQAGDFASFNLALCSCPSVLDRTLHISSSVFTGIHHSNLKPQTHHLFGQSRGRNLPTNEVIKDELFVLTADYLRVYSIHGKYWQRGYAKGLATTMQQYFKRLGLTSQAEVAAMARTERIVEETERMFLRLLFHGSIEFDRIAAYVRPDVKEFLDSRRAALGV
jgi:hypothetical protein